MANAVISWAQDNPLPAAAAAVGIIVVVMMVAGGGGGDGGEESAGAGSAGVQAYYAAVAQQGQAGAAIQIEQIKANASTNMALIAANYGIEKDKTWAPITAAANSQNAANTALQLKYQRELGIETLKHQHAMYDNYINLENSKLTQQQNIAYKQINAQKKSVFDKVLGAAVTVGSAYLTGGASLAAGGVGGGGGVKLPSVSLPNMGSQGTWIS